MVTSLSVFQDINKHGRKRSRSNLVLPLHQRDHEDEPERSRGIR